MATLAMARLKIHTDLLYKCRFIKSDNPPRRVNKYSPGCDFMVILSRAESCVINLPSPVRKLAPLLSSHLIAPQSFGLCFVSGPQVPI